MDENASVIILAGGRSRRMGQDKAWMMLDGQPLIERVARRLLPLATELLLSASDPERYQALFLQSLLIPARVVADHYPGFGPLAGIHAGLRAAQSDLVVVVAADMPFVNISLLEHMIRLADGYDGVVPHVLDPRKRVGALSPLHAVYRRSCLPAINRHLAANDRQAFCFFDEVRIRSVLPEEIRAVDPDLLSFFNVNTPDDWLEAQRIARQPARL